MSRQAVNKAASPAGSHITKSLGRNRKPLELKHLNMTRSVLFERLPGLFLPRYQEAVRKLASEEEPVTLRCGWELYNIVRKLKIDFQPLLQDLEGYKLWNLERSTAGGIEISSSKNAPRALPDWFQKRLLTATGIELTEFRDIEPANEGPMLSQKFYRILLKPFRGREKEGPTHGFPALSALPIDTPIPRSPSITTSAGGQLGELIRVVGGRTREEHKF
ncbi:hypothetical protein V8E51_002593 [Hyaloscypha variabilis]